LLSEAREEANWDKAKEHYESVQSLIIRGESLELFADVGRLLPDHIKPKCKEATMVIEEYVRDTKPVRMTSAAAKGTKRKRNADVMRNIPDGAVNGFVPSSKLISKRDSKKRKVVPTICSEDEDDQALQVGIGRLSPSVPPRRGRGRTKGKTTAKSGKKVGKVKPRGRPATSELSLSQLDRELADDTDDREIELGIDLLSPNRGPSLTRFSSPVCIRSSPEPHISLVKANEGLALRNKPAQQSQYAENQSYLLDSDDDEVIVLDDVASSVNVQSSMLEHSSPITPPELSSFRRSPLSHVPLERLTQNSMLPPPVPAHPLMTDSLPDSTFAPRLPAGVRRKRRRISSSPALDRRSEMEAMSSPPQAQVHLSQRQGPIDSRVAMEWLDLEAQVSGDDSTAGSSDHEDVESESDRR
jgi:ATP-dependent DNA helicase MPH1